MKKVLYITAVAWCLLMLNGCAEGPKRVLPNDATGGLKPGQTDKSTQTGVEGQGTRYLDATDGKDLSLAQIAADNVTPPLTYINSRLYDYGKKLDRYKELDQQSLTANLSPEETEQMVNCFKDLRRITDSYTTVQASLLQGSGTLSGAEMMALQKSDIEFIESPCGKMLATTDEDGPVFGQRGKATDLSQLETVIERYSANKQYEEIVQTWLQVPAEQVDRVDLNTRLRYANALMYLHQEDQAAKVYGQIVNQMSASEEQSTDLISLRKTLADLYTASGNYPAAEEQYKKISQDFTNLTAIDEWSKLQLSILERSVAGSPELTEYSGLLRNYLGFIPEKDGYKVVWQAEEFLTNYPYSAVSSNVDLIKKRAQEKADAWMNGFMGKVDELVAEKKFQEAIQLVENAPVDLMDEEKRNALKVKKEDFVLAEAVEKETSKLANVQELQQKWNSGMLLVKGERFDEAIAVFTEMLGTEYGTKAQEKIVEVSQLAAREERRKAADLFIRYTKTTDVEGQKKLLIESRKILKDILIKYPDVDIAEKVRGNIQRVEQEMNAIDPTLLSRVDMGLEAPAKEEIDVFDTAQGRQPTQPSASQLPILVQPPSQ
ncbi:hypothetical protein [Desulfopila aestuarii]|uniref:Tetratricopeptide repeat-containing protein n=1 Tax=Desulfopila aestuarii DSM 18488 TaxID=1121416 RepID=A0A1M7Y8L6_9BACT|nr:hypothetical protein [Desulfopila aestuarii]SHO48921.1 hypothetical protein SAMN02745220_02539 [Desulfopila aestuarii DSM 18488]